MQLPCCFAIPVQPFSSVRLAALASAILLGAAPAGAATGTGTAIAVVLRPLTIENNRPVVFGAFEAHHGAVSVSTTGERTGDSKVLAGAGSAAGEITVRGDANATYSVSGSGNLLVEASTGATLPITAVTFADAAEPGTEITVGTLTDGVQVLKVGATLDVASGQPPGSYSGGYTITVNYN